MQISTIQNEFLSISVKHHGAELCSIKQGKTEYMWQANPNHWNRHAPVLFPIIGELKNGEYHFEGKTYAMKRHGLARNLPFELIEKRENFALESTISGIGHSRLIKRAKENGYNIVLHFLWLPHPSESIRRVRQRVKKGGHHVPSVDIHRRYPRTFYNLVAYYLPLSDQWAIWNATSPKFIPLANNDTHAIHDIAEHLKV